jgi:hypothetical protein
MLAIATVAAVVRPCWWRSLAERVPRKAGARCYLVHTVGMEAQGTSKGHAEEEPTPGHVRQASASTSETHLAV